MDDYSEASRWTNTETTLNVKNVDEIVDVEEFVTTLRQPYEVHETTTSVHLRKGLPI